jgi:hypothetical protein
VVPSDDSGESALEEGLLENPEEDSGGYDGDRLPSTSETKVTDPRAEEVQVDPAKPVDSTRD